MSNRILLEIGVASIDDAVSAVETGADRLELNCALSLGGLTPSAGLFAEVRRRVKVPLIAMVRPRPGGFAYSDADFDAMIRDAKDLIAAGADGLAFGILTTRGEIDIARCRKLRDLCGDCGAIFHRAFDVTPEPFAALDGLIELGFCRVMTSGQAESAASGADTIADLVRHAAGRIEVLPAGGISHRTVGEIVSRTGCNQVHAGLRTIARDPSVSARPQIQFGRETQMQAGEFDRTDPSAVAALLLALKD